MFYRQPKILKYVIVDSIAKLKRLSNKMITLQEFSFDTETNTLRVLGQNKDFSLVGISISWGEYNNYYIPVGHRRYEDYDRQLELDTVVEYLKPCFEREDVRIIGNNLKFDMHVFARIGIFIKTLDLFDNMIASWLCDENTPNGLKENSLEKLKYRQIEYKEVISTVPKEVIKEFGLKANSRIPFDLVLIKDGAPYALDDAFCSWELYLGFMHKLEDEKMHKIYNKVYRPFIRVLFDMEEQGICVDRKRLEEMSKEINKDMRKLEYKMFELVGQKFNPSSSQQLSELLFGYTVDFEYKEPNKKQKEKGLSKKEIEKKQEIAYDKYLKDVEKRGLVSISYGFKVISLTDGGAPQTSGDVLWQLSRMTYKNKHKQNGVELCKLLLDYKKLDKLCSAFIDGLVDKLYDDGKMHPSFNIIGTDTGRLSCSEPNMQQLPRVNEDDKYQIRSLFIGSEYFTDLKGNYLSEYDDSLRHNWTVDFDVYTKRKKIIALDFSNLEMRVLAHFSEDKNLLEMFEKGKDTHGSTAVNMFELDCDANEAKKKYPHLRQAAKTINFMLMYGGGAYRLYEELLSDHDNPIDLGSKEYTDIYGVTSEIKTKYRVISKGEQVAKIYIDKYFDSYSGVAKLIKSQKKYAHRNGYVYTLSQRKRRLPDINSDDRGISSYCERLSVNAPIQGSAADITMSAQNRIALDKWYKEHGAIMLLQIHDELVFECPEEYVEECIEKTKYYMSKPFGDNKSLNLPLIAEADFGNNYAEAK